MREVPALNRIQSEYGERGVTIVAVNMYPRTGLQQWRAYWRSVGGGPVTHAQVPGREAMGALRVRYPGSTLVLDRQGREVFRDSAATDHKTLKAAVERAL